MMSAEIDVNAALKKINKSLSQKSAMRAIRSGFHRIGKQLHQDSKTRVPNDTGELYNSFNYLIDGDTLEAGFNTEYAMYQHRGMRADGSHIIENRPAGGETGFLNNTLESEIGGYIDIIQDEFKKAL